MKEKTGGHIYVVQEKRKVCPDAQPRRSKTPAEFYDLVSESGHPRGEAHRGH